MLRCAIRHSMCDVTLTVLQPMRILYRRSFARNRLVARIYGTKATAPVPSTSTWTKKRVEHFLTFSCDRHINSILLGESLPKFVLFTFNYILELIDLDHDGAPRDGRCCGRRCSLCCRRLAGTFHGGYLCCVYFYFYLFVGIIWNSTLVVLVVD